MNEGFPRFTDKKPVAYEAIPEKEWISVHEVTKELRRTYDAVSKLAEILGKDHPEWFKKAKVKGVLTTFFAKSLVELIRKKANPYEVAPEGWRTAREFCLNKSYDWSVVTRLAGNFRSSHPEWFKIYFANETGSEQEHMRTKEKTLDEHYAPELLKILDERLADSPSIPEGWMTCFSLAKQLGRDRRDVLVVAQHYSKDHPEWFIGRKGESNHFAEHYAPELVELITAEMSKNAVDPITGVFLNEDGKVFAPLTFFSNKYGIELGKLKMYVGNLNSMKGYDENGRATHLYEETGVENMLRSLRLIRGIDTVPGNTGLTSIEAGESALKQQLVDFVSEVGKGEQIEAQNFKQLVSLFGSASVFDVLYKFHPEFKGLPVQWVRSVIAEYIGDFLAIRRQFHGKDLGSVKEYLSEKNLRDELLEAMKESCLDEYHKKKKGVPTMSDEAIVQEYIENIRIESRDLQNPDVDAVVNDLELYYHKLLSIKKPEYMVDQVREGRAFPDMNQRINMQEIADKKKMLIADEMGLGKSASVILAKETLGVKQALVVVPSNVLDTWKGYLSDYFHDGLHPRVLVVENSAQLQGDLSEYEYILVSHERLTNEYTKELLVLDPGMLIVDEVHKLKNLTDGIRAQNLIALAQKIEGNDKYMALLSGTPVPNKVVDVAMILKLLYPEKFKQLSSKEMAKTIIRGDIIDLRTLLIPRMQMKSLRKSVEMPQHIEHPPVFITMSETERNIYGALLEEDELTATQKIQLLRQFVLNPEIIDSTPGMALSKFNTVHEHLREDFMRVKKIVMFVNNYVEGVIRGEHSLIPKLSLDPDIAVRVIEGDVSKKERALIQEELNTTDKKMLLVVSGMTADVGVDFSGGEMVYTYNEPWTRADQLQQLSRVYRPGLTRDLESKSFITEGTIEEGIHRFIDIKQRALEKLLKGVPLTELDREILEKTEEQDENKEVNPELARYYFNSWDMLMRIFGEVQEIGEEDFMSYLDKHGKELTFGEEYAKAYFDLGNRSYQSNANRIAATLIRNFIETAKQSPEHVKILDLASGPEMLKRHSSDPIASNIYSLDINPSHFAYTEGSTRVVGKATRLPFETRGFDYINFAFAVHYTRFAPSKNILERLEILKEMNRVLNEGGKVMINMVHKIDFRDFNAFKYNMGFFGFRVVDEHSGFISEEGKYKSRMITLEKTRHLPDDFSVSDLVDGMSKEQLRGFKFKEAKEKVRNQRQILTEFELGGKRFKIEFNEMDQKIYEEEQMIIRTGEGLKEDFGGIDHIPREAVVANSFIRYRPKKNYRLFRRLKASEGGVVIK